MEFLLDFNDEHNQLLSTYVESLKKRRVSVLDATSSLFDQNGVGQVSMNQIATIQKGRIIHETKNKGTRLRTIW